MTTFIVVMQGGMWLGYVTFGYIGDAIGRKRVYLVYLTAAAALVLAYGSTRTPAILLVLGPLVAFFGTGYFSGFGAVTAELYHTGIRATAQGFTYNIGRVVSAAAPFVVGSLAEAGGFRVAFAAVSAAFVLAALLWIPIPDTSGRALS
jgi:MFS family permease